MDLLPSNEILSKVTGKRITYAKLGWEQLKRLQTRFISSQGDSLAP